MILAGAIMHCHTVEIGSFSNKAHMDALILDKSSDNYSLKLKCYIFYQDLSISFVNGCLRKANMMYLHVQVILLVGV